MTEAVIHRVDDEGNPLTPVEVYLSSEGHELNENAVMDDVDRVLAVENPVAWDVARVLIRLAFRLLCKAAFRDVCRVRAADDR